MRDLPLGDPLPKLLEKVLHQRKRAGLGFHRVGNALAHAWSPVLSLLKRHLERRRRTNDGLPELGRGHIGKLAVAVTTALTN